MMKVTLIISTLFLTFSNVYPIPTVSPDTANAYLRSFLPWWPNNTDFSLKTAQSPEDKTNETQLALKLNSTTDENKNITELIDNEDDLAMLRVQDIPSSPLDELRPDSSPRSIMSDSLNHHDGNFIIDFDELGECPRDCSSDLREAMNIVLQDMSHVERYHRICEKYLNASTCVNEDARCDKNDRGMFEMMTSGLHYMCIEQELAFNATIKCIDDEAGLVQSECDTQCQTKNLFMNWMMRTAFQDSIQQGVNDIVGAATGTNANPLAFLQGAEGAVGGTPTGWADMLANVGQRPPSPQDPQKGFENFRQFTNDLCRIGDCMLDCIRSKFNTRCEGSAGTLLSEVFVRPIAASQNKLSILKPILGVFMPEQCNYLHNNADLKKHRIDATMDEELKRMYAEKMAKEIRERTQQDELLSNLVPLDKNGVPLPRALPDLQPQDSPLDVSVKTLDQLILDMYSKNETKNLNVSDKTNATTTTTVELEKNDAITNSTNTSKKSVDNLTGLKDTAIRYDDSKTDLRQGSGESSGEASGEASSEASTEASGEASSEESGEESGEASKEALGEAPEASGSASSEASGEKSSDVYEDETESSSDDVGSGQKGENSGSSSVAMGDKESSGVATEASGESSAKSINEMSDEEKYSESSGEASGEDFGLISSQSDNFTESRAEASAEAEEEYSELLEGSAKEYETAGEEILPLTPIPEDTYNM